jgi:hypothetical protein
VRVGFLAGAGDARNKELFLRDRERFAQALDLVFIDPRPFLYRTEETAFWRRGYARDRRPDCPQGGAAWRSTGTVGRSPGSSCRGTAPTRRPSWR